MDDRIKQIREKEKISHIKMYSDDELYKTETWLKKPIKTVLDILPFFKEYKKLNALDLGCGIGRNSISIAKEYKDIQCRVECVDILDLAIEKLYLYAKEFGVEENILGIISSIDSFEIKENRYDLIIGVSSLEHIASKEMFIDKLQEIKNGICQNGIVCMVINSQVKEYDKANGKELQAQFEVNLETDELLDILNEKFGQWTILKQTVQGQQYDIPRENGVNLLTTNVVTFVARK